ncbi:MAG: pilin biogenesis protein [Candidatus Moranbacteria bacterium GW2011_GWE2_35_2-]|nr:MAG: pilin biogenesis protein [Candidatus Moranbacteria bacterium GW2011_GWE2_35_2-]KKQ06128.1 MAG: pilin biogenesis protein [Candidatus Moranbacteria bacterium GW2011_GWF1_36_4]KKQ22530.1 MAG: pilin biogenesis protein [Candidatus Moranbacteria bacterium GW2011_GWF2_37_11]KKQ29599.1 MAG: pilin biogenesis protein [Candidatus Moranbacteria bacterium GW2011_GWD1_37_17]KKQ30530.1 MAG: pilin biogenesis protein [Candidatus Moranbacteria bacterium GW2011_GWE1_37_24]KKQ46814.1 MAG: pilin biogenesis
MKFVFEAKDQNGKVKKGKVEAVNKETAVEVLHQNMLVPFSIEQEKEMNKFLKDLQNSWDRVSQKELMIFFRQFSTLIGAKVSIINSLQAVREQMENKALRRVIQEISNDIEDGMTLAESLEKHPEIFSALTVSTVKAGEVSGNLQKSISYIADNIEKNYQLTAKIKGALFYPVFVIIAASIIGFLTMIFVIPKLTQVIIDMGAEIPWYTQVIITTSSFFENYWWAILVVILGVVGGSMYYTRTESGKRDWDFVVLKIPIIGKLARYVYITRFSSNFSMLLAGGIPIVQALVVVSEVVNNTIYKGIILRGADEVKAGGNISSIFSRSTYIPVIVTRMIKIGEETGEMNGSLDSIASFYEKETDNIVRNLTSLIEPVLIVFLGIGVAVLVFAILLPIYNITGNIK